MPTRALHAAQSGFPRRDCFGSRPAPGRTMEDTQRGAKAREAAMRLRAHRRNLVVWSPYVGSADRYGAPRLARLAGTRRIHRCIRTGALLTVIGLMRLARAVQHRWRPLLAGGVLTVAGVMLRGAWGAVLLPGLLFLLFAPLVPARPKTDRMRRSELERELAVFSHPAQRRLASQAMALYDKQFPGF